MIINIIGYIGTLCLILAGIPQLYKVINDGHALGLSYFYLLLVWIGLLLMGLYVILTIPSTQLLCSYGFQFIVFTLLIYKKKFPKEPMIH